MTRYAIVKEDGGFIEAAFNLVTPTSPVSPLDGCTVIEDPTGTSEYGGVYDGENWIPRDPGFIATQNVEKDMPVLYWIHDQIIAHIQSSYDGVANAPTKAVNAPSAVASSSALGSVETRFAREDHAHAINDVQQSQIGALQANVSSLLSLTGGLNTPAPATATPLVDAVSGALGTSAKYAREDHVHPLPAATSSAPSRALNSAGFQPSATKMVLVSYSVRITCTASLSGGQDGKIELMSDANATPTTVRATAQNRNSVSLAIALTAVNEQTVCLTYLVPAGHYVRLVSTQTTGTPSFAIISQTEVALG